MRILIIQSGLGVLRGGGENFTRHLFSEMRERGHQVTAMFTADVNGRYPIALPVGFRALPIIGWWPMDLGEASLSSIARHAPNSGWVRKAVDRLQSALQWRSFRWYCRRFKRRIEKALPRYIRDFDVLYVHGDTALASAVAQYRPTVLRLPGPVGPELAATLRRVNVVCANGDALLQIRQFLGDHAKELPIGIDSRLFTRGESQVRQRLGWPNDAFVIGYVGRLNHLKGSDILAAAFQKIVSQCPHARLLVVGCGEAERAIRARLSTELECRIAHIEPDIDHEQLAPWYRAMNLFVMPSRYENFSNALLEAMACGVPFLASDVGGNRLLAESGAGVLFPPGDAEGLSSRLREVMADETRLRERGDSAVRHIRSSHSWAVPAARLEQFYSVVRDRAL